MLFIIKKSIILFQLGPLKEFKPMIVNLSSQMILNAITCIIAGANRERLFLSLETEFRGQDVFVAVSCLFLDHKLLKTDV